MSNNITQNTGNIIQGTEKATIDLLAIEYCKAVQQGDDNKAEYCNTEIYKILYSCYRRRQLNNYQQMLCEEVFDIAVQTALTTYDPNQGSYCNYFTLVLRNKETDNYRVEQRHQLATSNSGENDASDSKRVSLTITDSNGNDAENPELINATSAQYDPTAMLNVEGIIQMMCDIVLSYLTEKKNKGESKYYPMIFTDDMVKLIHDGIMTRSMANDNTVRLNKAADHAFMTHFLEKKCSKLEDSFDAMPPQQRSRNSPYRLEYKVYAEFANVSTAAISNWIDKYQRAINIIQL